MASNDAPPVQNRRRSTVKRLMAQGEKQEKKEQAEQKVRDDEQPLSKLIPMTVARQLREVTESLAREIPQDVSEMRMARIRAPKSSTGAVLKDGATVEQAATHASLKALEQWVRILRPFASNVSGGLAELVARIVHMDKADLSQGNESELEDQILEVLPPASDPLGAALRRLVPTPELLVLARWEWLEDMLKALSYEESFDRTSFVHRSVTPSGMRQTGESVMSSPSRPSSRHSTGMLKKQAESDEAKARLSGPISWAGFNKYNGNRTCTLGNSTERYIRTVPGPAVYSDYAKNLSKPANAARGVYHSVGDRRTPCVATSLYHLDRFFMQDFRRE